MSFYFPPWESDLEPSQMNIRQFLDNLYAKFQPLEQARWNQSNIDTLFYAGEQRYINAYFNFYPQYNWQNFHFNIIQQPINMVTGFQRQHRKAINYLAANTEKSKVTDQYNKLIYRSSAYRGLNEKFSRGCEEACVQGMVLAQPYLDFKDDVANGTLDLKIWSYNSFIVDPYFRQPDMSDANYVWTQQYISKKEADSLFPDQKDKIYPLMGTPQRFGSFYFLPESYNMARNDLLVLSNVWYKWKKNVRQLYDEKKHVVYDFDGSDDELDELLFHVDFLKVIEVEIPYWKLAVVINDQLMFHNYNPLGFAECPFVPIFWNYDPQIANYDLRVRSLTRACRDAQYLFNRRIILNHDITESSINSGYVYKEAAVANPENLRYAGQGKDIIIKPGYELSDFSKIIPNAVPPSDLQLAEQLHDLMFQTTGVSLENFGLGDSADKMQSGLAIMMKQGAGLMVLQKYFDQWDVSLKLLGSVYLKIMRRWSPGKVADMIGEEPEPEFYSKMFGKYHVTVAEGLDTPLQQQNQFRQILELNQMVGGILPPQWIAKYATIEGKDELIQLLEQQQAQQAAVAQQREQLEQALLDAKLKDSYTKAMAQLAMARERHGRNESNIGLFEERLSEVQKNKALSTKAKMEAIEKMVDVIAKYGEVETALARANIESYGYQHDLEEDRDRLEAKQMAEGNRFLTEMLSGLNQETDSVPEA